MALVKYPLSGANSYVSRAEAIAYFADYLNGSAFTGATGTNQDNALILATTDINRENYKGTNNSEVDGFKWPRSGVTDPEGNELDDSVVPRFIEEAVMELALIYLQQSAAQKATETATNIRRVVAGPVEVQFFRPTLSERFPARVQKLLAFYFASSTAGSGLSQAFGTCEESGLEDFNTLEGFS